MTIFREEGPAALYKGFVPKVLRLAPGGGVLLLVVEFTLNVFRQGASELFPFLTRVRALLIHDVTYSARPSVHLSLSSLIGVV